MSARLYADRWAMAALASLLGIVSACSDGETDTQSSQNPVSMPDAGPVVASVNSREISQPQLDAFLEFRRQPLDQSEVRQAALNDLVDMLLLVDETQSNGLLTTQAAAALKVQEWSFLANLALSDMARSEPITEQDIGEEYARQVDLTGGTEYKLQHVLVASEAEALQLIARLGAGEPFPELLRELEGSGANGGDLGWVNLVQVPAGFSPVLKNLDAGEYSPAPISSQYGWHVVLLEDLRPFQPPALDQIEEGIRNSLSRQRLERYMENLRGKALIARGQKP
ncbi:MAG: peptidyl-prolyl cis-trans isomerase [Lysobacterales bacterium]